MTRRVRIALALLLLAPPSAGAQEALGRLFFTPEQRAELDTRRRARVPDKPAAVPAVAAPVTRMDGYVRSSRGRATVWVNGATIDDPALDRALAPDREGRLPVTVGDSGVQVRLKPGESLDRGTGDVQDLLGDGEIRLRRR